MSENIGWWSLLRRVLIKLWDKWPKCLKKKQIRSTLSRGCLASTALGEKIYNSMKIRRLFWCHPKNSVTLFGENSVTSLVSPKKKPNDLVFVGFGSLCHGNKPLRAILTALWAYNSGIQLHKIPAIWRKITWDGEQRPPFASNHLGQVPWASMGAASKVNFECSS